MARLRPAVIRLALADEAQTPLHEEIVAAVEAAAADAGVECRRLADPADEASFDALLMLGYPTFYPSFVAAPRRTRRICWYGENLPPEPPTLVQRVVRRIPAARLLDVTHDTAGRLAGARMRHRLLEWREQAAVEREWGRNVRALKADAHSFDELVVTSLNRVVGARLAGQTARWVPFGYERVMCGPLVAPDTKRDVDVVFLGRDVDARGRRARWLSEFERRRARSFTLQVVDRGLYGAQRHDLLARARIVLDIHRVPRNPGGLRYLLATAAGAALVSEIGEDDWLPGDGTSVVEAEPDHLASAVEALLEDEPRRRALVDAGQRLLQDEMSMASCLVRVLERPHPADAPSGPHAPRERASAVR